MPDNHTPGPWSCDYGNFSVYCETGAEVCEVTPGNHDDHTAISVAEMLANARLIAVAPELLAVCRKLFAWQCDDDPYACDDWMEFATELGAMAGRAVADADGRQ